MATGLTQTDLGDTGLPNKCKWRVLSLPLKQFSGSKGEHHITQMLDSINKVFQIHGPKDLTVHTELKIRRF